MIELLSYFSIAERKVHGSDDIPYDTCVMPYFSVARKQLVSVLPSSAKVLESMALSSAPYPIFGEEQTEFKDMRTKVISIV